MGFQFGVYTPVFPACQPTGQTFTQPRATTLKKKHPDNESSGCSQIILYVTNMPPDTADVLLTSGFIQPRNRHRQRSIALHVEYDTVIALTLQLRQGKGN